MKLRERKAKKLPSPSRTPRNLKTATKVRLTHVDQDAHGSSSQSSRTNTRRVMAAIDFGTTNTSIAYRLSHWSEHAETAVLGNFPGNTLVNRDNVQMPTVISYSNPGSGAPFLVGFHAQNLHTDPAGHAHQSDYPDFGYIEQSKLLLYEKGEHTLGSRALLDKKIDRLFETHAIKEDFDVIRDILTECVRHLKSVLEGQGITEDCEVELACCVPTIATPTSILDMTTCLRDAMREARFGIGGAKPYNLFFVNEAEAAMTHALNSGYYDIREGEVVGNLDAGGGTTDTAAHRVSHGFPLRLEKELVPTKGIMWGGSDVDAGFIEMIKDDLADGACLGVLEPGHTKQDMINACAVQFEGLAKRFFEDENDGKTYMFRCYGLKQSSTNPRLQQGCYVLTSKDMGRIFGKVVRKIEQLMVDLLDRALEAKERINTLVLSGGFSDSQYLRHSLIKRLSEYNKGHATNTRLMVAPGQKGGTGTAIGALMRTQNKENGPVRTLRLSVGVMRTISFEPDMYDDEVNAQELYTREDDGEIYIKDVIMWLLKVDQGRLQSSYSTSYISIHKFEEEDLEWIADEELVFHETSTKDFLKREHEKNKGSIPGGVASFKMTHLRERIMKETRPRRLRGKGKSWLVRLEMRLEVNDVDLKLAAFWPPNDPKAIEVPGSRICHNVRGLLDPGTK